MRKILGLGIFCLSAFAAVLLIFGQDPEQSSQQKIATAVQQNQLVEKYKIDYSTILPSENPSTPSINPKPHTLKSASITANLTDQLSQQLIAQNPAGPTEKGIKATNPEKAVDQILARQLANFDYKQFIPIIKDSDLKILAPTKPVEVQQYSSYFKQFQRILLHNLPNNTDFTNITQKNLQNITQSYDKTIKEFYNLEVPPELVNIHKKEISLLAAQRAIFANIAAYDNDPLLSFLSIQSLTTIYQASNELETELARFISKNNIKI